MKLRGSTVLRQRQIDACIAAQRGPNRISQARLAAQFGVGQRTISRWVRHAADPHPCRTRYPEEIKAEARRLKREQGMSNDKIAKALGVSYSSARDWTIVSMKGQPDD